MTLRTRFPPLALLAVLAASVGMGDWARNGANGVAATAPNEPEQTPEQPAQSIKLPVAKDQSAHIEVMQARPLFAPGRRLPEVASETQETIAESDPATPEPITVEPPPTAEAVPLGVRVVGTWAEGNEARVLLRSDLDQSEEWYSAGDDVAGWTLVEITQSSILLRKGETEMTVQMFE